MTERLVTLAAIAGAHGVHGEVRLKLFAESVDSLRRHRTVIIDGREMKLSAVRQAGPGAVASLEGIGDRDAAEQMRGKTLSVARSSLPPLESGEYYHADLIGLPCADAAGARLGEVVAVHNFGAGDLIEIAKPDGKTSLVPLKPGVAEQTDQGFVVDPLFLA